MDSIASFIRNLDVGSLDATLSELYGSAGLSIQRQRYHNLLLRLEKWSGCRRAVLVTAPGRTELGGNHTDHNNGVVLAAGVHLDCLAAACFGDGPTIRIRSEGFSGCIEVESTDFAVHDDEQGTSTALVRGVVAGFVARGWTVGGVDACVSGDVPLGAGLSSSAAFEVCVGQVINQLYCDGAVTPLELAQIGREAENIHFGKPCGFMDQLACASHGILSIDFMTPETPKVESIDCDFGANGYQLVVVDTGGSHADLTPEYAAIPDEMHRASRVFGQDVARGLTVQQVLDNVSAIRKEAGDRAVLRLIHFIEENERAQQQADALRVGDMDGFLALVKQSGDSSWRLLQNCISTTNALEQGIPLALTMTERFLGGAGAWRVQGGGFAGTIQAYIPNELVPSYTEFMDEVFKRGSVVPLSIRKPGFDCVRLNGPGGGGGV
ncbi:galactokinase [Pseudodesulfovibrio sp. JC047]|uniref:galactokinase n=1 Tax=Pseudodesulfovibrio sp. JC047 TaxID=2683199 RepID=UPI0013D668C8|nr:galactokinase family protein [Pseudodesulfovibrio sp. JC047]NDV20682.1 galactokinase [Pseudodesulfovibrio sp. JC047]